MKTLADLANFITKNKTFVSTLLMDADGYRTYITDYGYEPKDMTFYLLADSDANPVSVKDILREAHRYPANVKIALICEELRLVTDVKSFGIDYGNPSFGEGNSVVLFA